MLPALWIRTTTGGQVAEANLHAQGHAWGRCDKRARKNDEESSARYRRGEYAVDGVVTIRRIAAFRVDTIPL